jgi:hypothetical protein
MAVLLDWVRLLDDPWTACKRWARRGSDPA